MTNRLYYGDNLDVLREHIDSESVDLVYLDPPFNSNANYNILFRSPAGAAADSQIEAFEDTWHWNDKAEAAFHDVMTSGNTDVAELLRAMRGFLKENDMMAYLAMMAVRLIELHRVLKPTGSLYLHCDPTASHYLKLLLDGVFGPTHYNNEIIWRRYSRPKGSQFDARKYGSSTDTIFFYAKSDSYNLYLDRVAVPLTEGEIELRFNLVDDKGRYQSGPILRSESMGPRPNLVYEYGGFTPGIAGWRMKREKVEALDKAGDLYWTSSGQPRRKVRPKDEPGTAVDNLWSDIEAIGSQAQERLGYPTQKPLALLERIINASSNPGDVVLDPFCGCGTAVDAAQKLGRQWIGIDVTHLSIGLIERRMKDRYGDTLRYDVIGTPNDTDSALKLAADEPHQFQYWITQAIGGQPYQGGRKGMDRGIDGFIYFTKTNAMDKGSIKTSTEAAIISVKAGQRVGVAMVRDLKGVMEREKAEIGIFVCVILPTREMEKEAASAGVYTDAQTGQTYPRLQLYTLAEYFQGLRPKVPMLDRQVGYKKAGRAENDGGRQSAMDF